MSQEQQIGYPPGVDRPRVSIIIPCHDCGVYLTDAINSVIDQEPGNYELVEIIVVDDRSEDSDTLEILAGFDSSRLVRVMHNTGIRGAAAARNVGLRAVTTDWVAFLDGDDLLTPDSLKCRAEVLVNFPNARWIGGNWKSVDAAGKLIPCHESEAVKGRGVDDTPRGEEYEIVHEAFETNSPIHFSRPVEIFIRRSISLTSTHLVQTSLLHEVGLYDEGLRQSQDRHLYIRLAKHSDFIFIPEVLFLYRQHDHATTSIDDNMLKGRTLMFRKIASDPAYREFLPLLKQRIFTTRLQRAYSARKVGNRSKAIGRSIAALSSRPLSVEAWKCLVAGALGR